MAVAGVVLWFQFAYAIWQFVRVAKFCRLPYAILVHTCMWAIGRWSRPFAVRNFIVLHRGREKMYISPRAVVGLIEPWKEAKAPGVRDCVLDFSVQELADNDLEQGYALKLQRLNVRDADMSVNFKLCSRRLGESFIWNYLRDDPDCFARSADLIFPKFEILDRVRHEDGLRKICLGGSIPVSVKRRFLAVPDRERELNQNFLRILATIPLMMQAKGFQDQSAWISLAIIGVDQLSLLFNWMWQQFKESLFYAFHLFMIASEARFRPQTRRTICTFLSTISDRMMLSDEVRLNFIRLRKDEDAAYTMSPFNGTEFEIVKSPSFQRRRKEAVEYTVEKFGRYEQANGELFPESQRFPPDGTPIISHVVQGSRIDSMFLDGGGFYNFINNEHLHFGMWRDGDKENFQDLLQVMEERQMLPFRQTDAQLLKSLKFNIFLNPGNRLEDITFVKVKKNRIVGGKA